MRNVQRTIEGMKLSIKNFRALLCISLRVSTYFSMGYEHFCDEGYKTYH